MTDPINGKYAMPRALQTAGRLQKAHNARTGKGRPLNREEFWQALSDEERAFWREMGGEFGPLQYLYGWEE